jgi:hypothetical protein
MSRIGSLAPFLQAYEPNPTNSNPKVVAAFHPADFRFGSLATDAAGLACRLMSVSVPERPTSSVAAKRRDGPHPDVRRRADPGNYRSEHLPYGLETTYRPCARGKLSIALVRRFILLVMVVADV